MRRANRIWLVAILILGGALRLFPVWFGLPYPQARPDEETAIGHAVDVLDGAPNPEFFHWPSLTFYRSPACCRSPAPFRVSVAAPEV